MTEPRRYAKGEAPEDLDDNITLDANDDRWEWRRRIEPTRPRTAHTGPSWPCSGWWSL